MLSYVNVTRVGPLMSSCGSFYLEGLFVHHPVTSVRLNNWVRTSNFTVRVCDFGLHLFYLIYFAPFPLLPFILLFVLVKAFQPKPKRLPHSCCLLLLILAELYHFSLISSSMLRAFPVAFKRWWMWWRPLIICLIIHIQSFRFGPSLDRRKTLRSFMFAAFSYKSYFYMTKVQQQIHLKIMC